MVLLLVQPALAEVGTLVATAAAMAGALIFVGVTAPSIDAVATEAYGILSCLVTGGIALVVAASCGDLRGTQEKVREGILDAVVVMIKD
jgi:ABC-type Fe3+-siderophore transport system permease subunit